MPSQPDDPRAEHWAGKHGYLDGGWWGSTNIGEADQKRGFIEGYASCATPDFTRQRIKTIAVAVDHFYDLPTHEKTPIADVIGSFLSAGR